MPGTQPLRLLPWTGPEGKPCYLATDGQGPLSRLADSIESIQLGMGRDLLGHAQALLTEQSASHTELHFLASRLTEALDDALRVAVSRGSRQAPATDTRPGEGS